MRVSGTATLAAPPDRLLAVLRDPRRFAAALPNVDQLDFEPGEDGSFRAKIRPAIALGEVPIETVWHPRELGAGSSAAEGTAADGVAYAMEGGTGEHRVELEATVTLRADTADTADTAEGADTAEAAEAAETAEVAEAAGPAEAALGAAETAGAAEAPPAVAAGKGAPGGADPEGAAEAEDGTAAEWTVEFEVTGTMRSAGQRTIAAIVAAQAEAVLQAAASSAAAA